MSGTDSYMNIDLIGSIYIVDEIIYYDKLLTFTCKNDIGAFFLASCIELDTSEKWLFLPLSESRLIQILRGGVTAYHAFKESELNFLWEVSINANDYSSGKARKVLSNSLKDDDLPDKDIVYDILAEETFSLESEERKKIVQDAVKERREIFDLSLEMKDSHVHEIEAAFLGKVLASTQNLVNVIAHNKGFNAKVPKHIKDNNKLIYSGEYAASFGIRLKSNTFNNILNESELQDNLSVFLNLLEAKNDTSRLIDIFKELNPSVVIHYKKFLDILRKEEVSIKTYCAYPNKKYRNIDFTLEDVTNSLKALEFEIKEIIKEDTVKGRVVAVDTTTKTFKFVSNDDETINATIGNGINIDEYKLPKFANISLKITTKLNDFTGQERIGYELLKLEYE